MINLIPTYAKQALVREYWMRVAIIWIMLVTGACCVIALVQLPSYVLLHSQLTAYEAQFAQAEAERAAASSVASVVVDTNELVQALTVVDEPKAFSTYITELDAIAGAAISLNRFSLTYAKSAKEPDTIVIGGEASTRTALVDFSTAVSEHPGYESADVPLASLAQDRDVTFEITVVPVVR